MPETPASDTSVTVTPRGDGVYSFAPFPFAGDELVVRSRGRYLEPLANGNDPGDLGALLRGLKIEEQVFRFVVG